MLSFLFHWYIWGLISSSSLTAWDIFVSKKVTEITIGYVKTTLLIGIFGPTLFLIFLGVIPFGKLMKIDWKNNKTVLWRRE